MKNIKTRDTDCHHKILIIDNDPISAKLITEALATENYLIQIAFDTQEALDNAKKFMPDLIILDITTPAYNGPELIDTLKTIPLIQDIPIIIATDLDSENREQALNTGADEFLNKPVNSTELLTRVRAMLKLKIYQEQLKVRKKIEFNFPGGATRAMKKEVIIDGMSRSDYINVLLVDDNLIDVKSIQAIFVDEQFIFSVVETGEKAVALAQSNQFDLMILDILLPDINGLDAYQRIKRIDTYQHVPVVFVTSVTDHDYKINCIEAGADDVFIRPINGKEFKAKIQSLLKKKIYMDELQFCYQTAIDSAIKDGLTGLYKRSYFIACLDQEIKRVARNQSCLSVMMIDIDNFKVYNDNLGHLGGDAILCGVGKIILNNIREIDLAARYGGEEFIVLLADTKKENALIIAQRMQAALSELPLPLKLVTVISELTVSIGIADFPNSSKSPSGLLNKADLMLYQAKKTGKNKACLCDD